MADADRAPNGYATTKLIVIRGNSGAGKSTVARQLQRRHGRSCALVEQGYLRRVVLRERDIPGGLAPMLIEQTVRFALDHHYHVVLEGILTSSRHRSMIATLRQVHRGGTFLFYLQVSWQKTVRRHITGRVVARDVRIGAYVELCAAQVGPRLSTFLRGPLHACSSSGLPTRAWDITIGAPLSPARTIAAAGSRTDGHLGHNLFGINALAT